MASPQVWNARNPAVKRIVQELRECQRDDNPDILAEALEENIFEWHFVIRGAWDTEFEGGIYHGRIIMPAEYPFKPPAFVMLSESGRFETGVKICLSISSFHPESWQPSWSVRSALVALIAFMQTPGNGAIGSLDHSPEIRREMAVSSRAAPPKHRGNAARQEVINQLHTRMLELEEASKQLYRKNNNTDDSPQKEGEAKGEEGPSTEQQQEQAVATNDPSSSPSQSLPPPSPLHTHETKQGEYSPFNSPTNTSTPGSNLQQQQQQQSPPPSSPPPSQHDDDNDAAVQQQQHQQQQQHHHHHQLTAAGAISIEDKGLTSIAVLLIVAIVALLLRRLVLLFRPGDWNDNTVFDFSASQLEDTEL